MGRKIQTEIPLGPQTLQKYSLDIAERKYAIKNKCKKYHDQTAKSLPSLSIGQRVCIQNPLAKLWDVKGSILKEIHPRSYIVERVSGGKVRRNRIHLKKSLSASAIEPKQISMADDLESICFHKPEQLLHNQNVGNDALRRSTRIKTRPTRLGVDG